MWEEVVRLCMCFESIFIDIDYRRNRILVSAIRKSRGAPQGAVEAGLWEEVKSTPASGRGDFVMPVRCPSGSSKSVI